MKTFRYALAAGSLATVLVAAGIAPALAGTGSDDDTDQAPLPTCRVRPAEPEQGDELRIRGRFWAPASTITVFFDVDELDIAGGGGTTDTTTGTTPGTTDTTGGTTPGTLDDHGGDDDSSGSGGSGSGGSGRSGFFQTGILVGRDGRFKATFVIPEDEPRGTHSVGVAGTDEGGRAAHCARIVQLDEHPEIELEPGDDTATTAPSRPDGSTPTTGSTSPTTEGTVP
jgi:hypothetical protein